MSQEAFKLTRSWDEKEKKHHVYTSVVCGQCGFVENIYSSKSSSLPIEVMVKKMQQRHWVMGQRRKDDLCPKCVNQKANEHKVMKLSDFQKPDPTAAVATPLPTAPTREAKRLVILALEDNYLGAEQGYQQGYDDERIARDLNVPRKLVSDLREEFYGPAVDPEVLKLRADLKAFEAKLAAAQTNLSDLRATYNDLKERASKKGML